MDRVQHSAFQTKEGEESDWLTEFGKDIYAENPFFSKLAEFMEHPLSREFYQEYCSSQRIDSTLFFLWMYEQIEHKQPTLEPYQKIAILNHIIHTKHLREKVFDEYFKVQRHTHPQMIDKK